MDYLPSFKKSLKKFIVKQAARESIEPEEVLLDAEKVSELQGQKIETPIKPKAFIVFFAIMLIAVFALAAQAGYFQIFKNNEYSNLVEKNSLRSYPVLAARGLIYDRNLKPLVSNLPSFNIWLAPQDLPKDKAERDTIIEQISYAFDLNPKDIYQKLLDFDFNKEQRILLASNIEPNKILTLESRVNDFPFLSLEEGVIRRYLFQETASHVLGYTGRITKEESRSFPDYFLSERIGKNGLEAEYEQVLRGQAGEQTIEVDNRGRQIKDLGVKDPVAGQNIVTTIDLGLQQKIFEELSRTLKDLKLTKATAVAMNPKNGQILSLVSFPSFDNNIFEQNLTQQDLSAILNEPDQPLFNRAISGQYPTGSTLKPMIGAAALQEGIVKPSTVIFDSGSIVLVNQYNPQVIYTFPDWKTHGAVNMYSAIAQSCDVYFYTVGGGYGSINGLGVERIKKYLKLFGFGKASGVDLSSEEAGLVPDEEWKQKQKNENWFIGDTYHISIGQGFFLATPLQLASAISSIANGGKIFKPYLVDKIIDSDKNSIKIFEPNLIRENFINKEHLSVIREGMREAVTSGSARLLADLPIKAAGKTGTAQMSGQERPNAWFVSFAPYSDPEIVLVVMVENAGEGSSVSAPIAKEVLKWYFNRSSY